MIKYYQFTFTLFFSIMKEMVKMKKLLIKLITGYQNMPLASHGLCRFYPTCSNYAIEAIEIYGPLKGSFLTIKRILRCNPLGGKGYDPVIKEDKR